MYDINRIKKEFYEVCENAGMDLKLPISINGRLTRTLGRVRFTRNVRTGYCELRDVEFSRQLLETASDKSVRDVILHEAAHAIVTYRTSEAHGHDDTFKAVCAEIGTDNDGVATEVERTVEVKSKYEITCPNCGIVGRYSRACTATRHIENYTCRMCGCDNLSVIQNW